MRVPVVSGVCVLQLVVVWRELASLRLELLPLHQPPASQPAASNRDEFVFSQLIPPERYISHELAALPSSSSSLHTRPCTVLSAFSSIHL